jgi:hypothetical protein
MTGEARRPAPLQRLRQRPASTPRDRDPVAGLLSWSHALPRRIHAIGGSAPLVQRSLPALARAPFRRTAASGLEVFPPVAPRRAPRRPCDPSAELHLLQSLTGCRRTRVQGMLRVASREVCGSFSTTHRPSPPTPGLPHPVRSVFRVSRPLDGFLLGPAPGLVSCRSALGVPPLQSLSLDRSRTASRRPMPSCRSPTPRAGAHLPRN